MSRISPFSRLFSSLSPHPCLRMAFAPFAFSCEKTLYSIFWRLYKGWLELPIDGRKIFWIALVLCYELCSVIDLGISRLCLSQTGAKPKLTATWSMAFSRALESLSSHCLLVIFTKLWLAVAIDLFWSRKAQTSDSSRSFQPLPRRGVFGAVMKSHKMFTWWWFRIGFSEFHFESTNFEM